jgi:menaquinone-dependent protoporphyrinogen oxidase
MKLLYYLCHNRKGKPGKSPTLWKLPEYHQVTITNTNCRTTGTKTLMLLYTSSTIHMHKYQFAVKHYIKKICRQLESDITFLSASLPQHLVWSTSCSSKTTVSFLKQTGWKPLMTSSQEH